MARFAAVGVVFVLTVGWSPAADAQACVGDCNGDGIVAISENVTCVNVALIPSSIGACPDCDGDGDGRVGISDLVRSVAIALRLLAPSECISKTCLDSGGSISTGLCCLATGDFPDTCAIGACSCAPENSHEVSVCDCGDQRCFDGFKCVMPAEHGCLAAGGGVSTSLCCLATGDFPDTCAIGACSCAPDNSHEVSVCDCGDQRCFNGSTCVTPAEDTCLDSGGTISSGLCCNAVGDFPDTCTVGACSCPPQDSHQVMLCDCGAQRCYDGSSCTAQ